MSSRPDSVYSGLFVHPISSYKMVFYARLDYHPPKIHPINQFSTIMFPSRMTNEKNENTVPYSAVPSCRVADWPLAGSVVSLTEGCVIFVFRRALRSRRLGLELPWR